MILLLLRCGLLPEQVEAQRREQGDSVGEQLRRAAEKADADGIISPKRSTSGAEVVSTTLYDVYGRRVTTPKGIVIERNVYSDGSIKVVKNIYR